MVAPLDTDPASLWPTWLAQQNWAAIDFSQLWPALIAGLALISGLVVAVKVSKKRASVKRGALLSSVAANAAQPLSSPKGADAKPDNSLAVPLGMIDRRALEAPAGERERLDPLLERDGAASRLDELLPSQVTAAERTSELAPAFEITGSPSTANQAASCANLLASGQRQAQSGASTAAAELFRDVIRIAALNGLSDHHAAARLELGELARQEGDLITACEHWQIARALFHDLKNTSRAKATEARMRDHGCPTDWVLNDF